MIYGSETRSLLAEVELRFERVELRCLMYVWRFLRDRNTSE